MSSRVSVLRIALVPDVPPATKTRPSGRVVAVGYKRTTVIAPPSLKVFVADRSDGVVYSLVEATHQHYAAVRHERRRVSVARYHHGPSRFDRIAHGVVDLRSDSMA